MSDHDITDPLFKVELELAISAGSELSGIAQDDIPRWFENAMLLYGRSCFDKGERYAHDKDTLVNSPRSHHGSGVFPELADAIADALEPSPLAGSSITEDEPTQPGRKRRPPRPPRR